MAGILQKLLGVDEILFNVGIKALEKSTGNSGLDTKLIADVYEKAHKCMRLLGLDTKDTTAKELYHSLISIAKKDRLEDLLCDYDYTMLILDDQIISFNLIDVIENSHHELKFEKQMISHGQRALRGEVVSRYLDHARTHDQTTLEIARSIGLLLEKDACYNSVKHNRKVKVK